MKQETQSGDAKVIVIENYNFARDMLSALFGECLPPVLEETLYLLTKHIVIQITPVLDGLKPEGEGLQCAPLTFVEGGDRGLGGGFVLLLHDDGDHFAERLAGVG